MPTEADTCRTYVVPNLYAAGWLDEQIREQVSFTDGRIIPVGHGHTPPGGAQAARKPGKRADYILRYRTGFPIAVVEAKAEYKNPGDGLQQAMEYAEILDLRFAYSTNGRGIVEHDYITGREQTLDAFPAPDELWSRLNGEIRLTDPKDIEDVLFPFHREVGGKTPRYYQEIAINRAAQAVIRGQQRILLTMATGTGKTFVAFQIVWKLWKTRRKTKILFLADRNVLWIRPKTVRSRLWGTPPRRFRAARSRAARCTSPSIRQLQIEPLWGPPAKASPASSANIRPTSSTSSL